MRGNPNVPLLWRADAATTLDIARNFRTGSPTLRTLMATLPPEVDAPAATPTQRGRAAAALRDLVQGAQT
ncbi:hypothetical protein, partial [Rhodobaculum claviforme]